MVAPGTHPSVVCDRRAAGRVPAVLRLVILVFALLGGLLFLGSPTGATGAAPPNLNDPCSTAGRDTCGTTAIGFYKNYRYGVRWFGSYRSVVRGERSVYCIDLRYWVPARQHRYREMTSSGLRNRDGKAISQATKRRIAYAVWTYGRDRGANQSAAVMLYVHAQMGDGRPGEVDPSALNPQVVALYRKISRQSARLAGPYRIKTQVPSGLRVGEAASATIQVRAASGAPLPNVRLAVRATGTSGVPKTIRANRSGIARVSFTPNDATSGVKLSVTSKQVPSTLPKLYNATTRVASRNSQRVAAPASQTLSATVTKKVARAKVTVTTAAEPQTLLVGESSKDTVTLAGLPAKRRAKVTVRLHGPFRSTEDIRCNAEPAWTGSFEASGSGKYTTPEATLSRPGVYTYQIVVPGNEDVIGVTTPCGVPAETIRVETQPAVTTVVSEAVASPGAQILDRVNVTGLSGEPATVAAALYGPFASREAITCDGEPVWRGTVEAQGDGEYFTEAVTLVVPGYYTYVEAIAAGGFVRAAETACGEVAETTIITGTPAITTKISDQSTAPGATVTDTVEVSGLGSLTAPVQVELWGPFQNLEAIRCEGSPYWSGTFTATGDGTYKTDGVTLDRAGYYTYVERIGQAEAYSPTSTECGEVAETTLARATPRVTTVVSKQIATRGTKIFDTIKLKGLGKTSAPIEVELFGPFASREAITCNGKPFWSGRVTAKGDGQIRSPAVTVSRAGFYTYREKIVGSNLVRATSTRCALVAETSLAAPAITTGRGEQTKLIHAGTAGGRAPTRVRVPGLGIDAPAAASGIDIARNQLGVPAQIQRTGWWRDGRAPGAKSGAILIAGHVDSARGGAGAFIRLPKARAGELVTVTTKGGRTYRYRVQSVRSYLKKNLPNNVYSQRGRARLVLVTCGGPFDRSSGFYRDNIVVTAVPV